MARESRPTKHGRLKMRRELVRPSVSPQQRLPPLPPLLAQLESPQTAMAGPLSITDLLEKQRKEKEEAAKVRASPLAAPAEAELSLPQRASRSSCRRLTAASLDSVQPKFLTKAERAALALEKRQKEIEEQKALGDRARREREALDRKVDEERRAAYSAPVQHHGHPSQQQNGYVPGGPNVRGGRGRGAYGGGRGGRGGYDGGGRGGYNDGASFPVAMPHSLPPTVVGDTELTCCGQSIPKASRSEALPLTSRVGILKMASMTAVNPTAATTSPASPRQAS
jgi:hypothetical protein